MADPRDPAQPSAAADPLPIDRSGAIDPPSRVGGVPARQAITGFLRAHGHARPRTGIDRTFGAPVLTAESRPHYHQALAERAVADELSRLGDDWVVLHALPIDSMQGDIDHVVIGPAGIFSLSSHYLAGQTVSARDGGIHVGNHRENHIRNVEFDVGRVERRLAAAAGRPVHVIGVIVVVRARVAQLRDLPRDVALVEVTDLVDWLRSRPDQLDRGCVERVSDVAFRPSTWMPQSSHVPAMADAVERFETVRQDVDAATRSHRLWLVTLSAGVLGLLAFATWGVVLQASMP